MSREMSDSEIVYELVTSKYKIAERNRLAKYRFLNKTIMSDSSSNSSSPIPKRRDSEPPMAETEKATVKLADISVPGTPVSSRYMRKLKGRIDIETDSEAENEDDNSRFISKEQQQQQSHLQESLKKFTSDMKKLQSETSTASHDASLENYFESADKSKTYQRDFSEVASEITINKKDPKAISRIEQYFTESTRRGSLTRDFNEVVQSFDPQNPTGREQFKSLSKPGTPISSKFIKVERVKLEPFNIKNLEKILDEHAESILVEKKSEAPEKPKRTNAVPLSPSITVTTPGQLVPEKLQEKPIEINVDKVADVIEIKDEPLLPIASNQNETNEATEKKSTRKCSNVSFSSTRSDISVPGTPVNSRHVFRKVDDDDDDIDSDIEIIDSSEITALAQEFAVKIDALVQKTNDEVVVDGEGEKKLLIIYDDGKSPEEKLLDEETANKVKEYLEKSEKESSYQRTFSEVASFNEPSTEVKEKVEKYFKDSDAKKSLTRGFSEAINYIEPVDIEALLKPGTPVSSKNVECVRKKQLQDKGKIITEEDGEDIDPELLQGMEAFLKAHEALHYPLQDFKADKYFEESTTRKTLRRDFSEVFGQLGSSSADTSSENPDVQQYFEQSEAQKSFQRQFSEALQTLPPRMKDILIEESKKKKEKKRTNSVSSVTSDPEGSKKNSNKYAVDKYFAASLYRTAFQRQLSERRGSEPNKRLVILEDENVFGETDLLRGQVFVNDDETPIRKGSNYEQQNVQFWRDFLKPYNLNLPSDIVMRDELIDKYTKYSLE